MGPTRRFSPAAIVAGAAALASALAATGWAQSPPPIETDGSREGVPQATWQTVPAAGGKAKVWAQTRYPDDFAKAQAIANELTNVIWPKLTGLFWAPLHDDKYTVQFSTGPFEIEIHRDTGGGPELDIYLVHYEGNSPNAVELGGHTWAADRGRACGQNPRYITLESDRPMGGAHGPGILNSLAHELTHAIEHATPWLDESCDEFRWMEEATATWAEQLVYPNAESEHVRAVFYMNDTEKPLDFEVNPQDQRHYGAYLFPFDLELRGHVAAIPKMWRNFGSMSSLHGIEAALGSVGQSFEKFFPRFMLDNWNRPSVDDYQKKDGLEEGARVQDDPEVVDLPGGGKFEKVMPLDLKYLSSIYRYFRFQPAVRTVIFENEFRGVADVQVWAIEKLKGQWQPPRDLTGEQGATWCRGRQGGDLDELVLVFGNTKWPRTPAEEGNLTSLIRRAKPKLTAIANGCTDWEGTVSGVYTHPAPADGTVTETSTTVVRFEIDPDMEIEGEPPMYWRAGKGTLHWTVSVTGECACHFSGTIPFDIARSGEHMGTLQIETVGEGESARLKYGMSPGPWPVDDDPHFVLPCPEVPLPSTLIQASWWFMTELEGELAPAGAQTLEGRHEMSDANSTSVWTWTLHAVP